MSIEAMKQMVEALEDINSLLTTMTGATFTKLEAAINTGRQAIAEAEKQEPVAWMQDSIELYVQDRPSEYYKIPLYTHPQPKREPLTDEQIWDAVQHGVIGSIGFPSKAIAVARAIEAAHGIKGAA